MKNCFLFLIASFPLLVFRQSKSISALQPNGEYENISNQKLFSDSLVSSFVIWIKKEVKPHKHFAHSEHVYVLEGEAEMKSGSETFIIKPGDMVFIPKNTVHSLIVKSAVPIKVLSIQAPEFDGKDRIMVE